MSLNLADRLTLRPQLVPRCTAAVANYALYILGEDSGASNHENRLAWAESAIRNPGALGEELSWHVINQSDYIDGGTSIADATLTGAVEAAINTYYIQPAT